MRLLLVGFTTLKGAWELKFPPRNTKKEEFVDENNRVIFIA
jgi:hypothetical protein